MNQLDVKASRRTLKKNSTVSLKIRGYDSDTGVFRNCDRGFWLSRLTSRPFSRKIERKILKARFIPLRLESFTSGITYTVIISEIFEQRRPRPDYRRFLAQGQALRGSRRHGWRMPARWLSDVGLRSKRDSRPAERTSESGVSRRIAGDY